MAREATATQRTPDDFYVDLLMREWRLDEQSEVFQARVRLVLRELVAGCQLILRREPRLEVMVLPDSRDSVWAYFPIHRRRRIARELQAKPETRVLLLFDAKKFTQEHAAEDYLRDHLGHTLLFLRSPKAWNDCDAAWKEWLASVHDPAQAKKTATASAKVRSAKAKAKATAEK
jgi:hypothetical protein